VGALTMDTITARIEFAFADVERPSDLELLHPDYAAADLTALEAVEDWRDLADEAIEREPGALAILSPAGFRHFLPAYMRWVCRHGEENPDAEVVAATFRALTPKEGELAAIRLSKFSLIGAEQVACIAAFCERMAQHPGAHDARAYWRMRAGYLPAADE
jgi:hypothetical protein